MSTETTSENKEIAEDFLPSFDRDDKAIQTWARKIDAVQDRPAAEAKAIATGQNPNRVFKAWRSNWQSVEYIDAEASKDGSRRFYFHGDPNGIVSIVAPEAPQVVFEVKAEARGGMRPVEFEPFPELFTAPYDVQLCHVVGNTDIKGKPRKERVAIRAVHAPKYFAYDDKRGKGLKIVHMDIETGAKTPSGQPVLKKAYQLQDIGGDEVIVPMWNGEQEVDSTSDRRMAYDQLRFKLSDSYPWVAIVRLTEGEDVAEWLAEGRKLIWGADHAERQVNDAKDRIEQAGHRDQQNAQDVADF